MSETSQPESPGLTGRALGDFVIRERIGEGGFGAVYRAEQQQLGREAVVKVLHSNLRHEEQLVQRFLREAKLASTLDHPFAAHIYAFGAEADGLLWIAMELVRGTPLDKVLEAQGPIPPARLVPLIERLCEVVHSAHEQGIVHRDLKPANVMVLSRAGRLLPKLLDLGIAKLNAAHDDGPAAGPSAAFPPPSSTFTPVEPLTFTKTGTSTQIAQSLMQAATSVELTQHQGPVGSPHYMAPEQWVSAGSADARTDIYALGVLTYRCLTGRYPFDGNTTLKIAAAHARKPVPPLGAEFPEDLHRVLAKAMAKVPAERYASALEFSSALREASQVTEVTSAQLPQLDDEIRRAFVTEGPQPLAEAVATLEAARSIEHAFVALGKLRGLIVSYLGTLALAARSRVGPGSSRDSAAVLGLFEKLRTSRLSEAEWLELTLELCRPFARMREAHPLPDLLAYLFAGDTDAPSEAWMQLLALCEAPLRPPEHEAEAALVRQVAEFSRVLKGLVFVFGYPLCVARSAAEKWVGVRRVPRLTAGTSGTVLEGQPYVADADGRPLLALWPFAQALVPTPGAAEELFLLDGDGRHGARLVSSLMGFERHDPDFWGWFRKSVVDVESAADAAREADAAPYMGLASFSASQASNYFGRERESEAFANRLRQQPFLAVVGPSGVGKSSFIQAGVVPLLPPGWRVTTVRPGRTPLQALAAGLVPQAEVGALRDKLSQDPRALRGVLLQAAEASRGQLLLVVDQFEELLTLCHDAEERRAYTEALVHASVGGDDPVRVVLTMRDDFLIRAQQLPALRERLTPALQLLATPVQDDLLRILVEPARKAGYEFEDDELPRQMVAAVAEQPGALALLSFTASKLWELRDRHLRRLTRKAHDVLGGVGGALAHHAESTIAGLGEADTRLVREAFRHLVTSEGTRAVLSRDEMNQLLGASRTAEEVLERLVNARLLVTSEGASGDTRVEVIHEALLSSWPRLVKWQREDAENARLRDQLRAAARQWEERSRARGLLWRGEALLEYQVWRARYTGAVTVSEKAFGDASEREEQRARRLRRGGVAVVIVALVVGLLAVVRSAYDARQRLVRMFEEQGRGYVLTGQPMRALPFLQEALASGRDLPALRFLVARGIEAISYQTADMRGHKDLTLVAAWSKDGSRVVSCSQDATARLWDVRSGRQLQAFGHDALVSGVVLALDDTRVLSNSIDNVARAWDVASGKELRRFEGVRGGALSPDGRLWALGALKELWLVDVATLEVVERFALGHQGRWPTFSPSGKYLAVFDGEGNIYAWEGPERRALPVIRSPEKLRQLELGDDGLAVAHTGTAVRVYELAGGKLAREISEPTLAVQHIRLDKKGARLAIASSSPSVKLWDVHSGTLVGVLEGHSELVNFVEFDDQGRLATGSADGTARLWDTQGQPLITFFGHADALWRGTFSPDGKSLVTTSFDHTLKVWDTGRTGRAVSVGFGQGFIEGFRLSDGRVVAVSSKGVLASSEPSFEKVSTFAELGGEEVLTLRFSPDERLASIAQGKKFTVYDARTWKPRWAGEHPKDVIGAEFSPDGRWVVSAGFDEVVWLWDLATGKRVRELRGHTDRVNFARFSPDSKLILTGSIDQSARVWDVATGAQLSELKGHTLELYSGAFFPDSARVVTGGADKLSVVWDARSGRKLLALEGFSQGIRAVAVSHDGELIATSGEAGAVGVWDARAGALLTNFRELGDMPVASFAKGKDELEVFSSTGTFIAWNVSRDARSVEELGTFLRCRVPFVVEKEALVRVGVDLSACSAQTNR